LNARDAEVSKTSGVVSKVCDLKNSGKERRIRTRFFIGNISYYI